MAGRKEQDYKVVLYDDQSEENLDATIIIDNSGNIYMAAFMDENNFDYLTIDDLKRIITLTEKVIK